MSDSVDTGFTVNLALALYQNSQDNQFTDFKIRAGSSSSVSCLRSVLCANSDYLKAICKSGSNEVVVDAAILKEGEAGEILRDIVQYMYLGKTNITARNVASMIVVADLFTLRRLIGLCEIFMLNNLSLTNLLSYHKIAKKIKLVELKVACEKLGQERFSDVIATEWFLSLSVEEVKAYLQADDLQAACEDDVMQALVRWFVNYGPAKKGAGKDGAGKDVTHEIKERYTNELFQCVRVNHCSASKLKDLAKSDGIPKPLKLKIIEYLQYGQHSGNKAARRSYCTSATASTITSLAKATTAIATPLTSSSSSSKAAAAAGAKPKAAGGAITATPMPPPPPTVSYEEQRVILVGGTTLGSKVHDNAVFLDKQHQPQPDASILTHVPDKQGKQGKQDSPIHTHGPDKPASQDCGILTHIPLCDGAGSVSVCATSDGFIVSGGCFTKSNNSTSCIKRYCITDHSWTDLPDMLHPCHRHGSVCLNNRFLVTVGGVKHEKGVVKERFASVSVLNLNTKKWVECQPLKIGVSVPGVTAVDYDVLVMGGYDGNKDITHVCRYDSRTAKRTDCPAMPKPCQAYNRTVTVGTSVFVLHWDSRIFMQYDAKANQWLHLHPHLPCPVTVAWDSAVVLHKGRILVTGGLGNHGTVTDLVQSYDIDDKVWRCKKQTMPLPLREHAAIVVKMPLRK